jgi:twinkle protein
MGRVVQHNQPCPRCSSSDAYQIYEDGGYCFSCGKGDRVEEVDNGEHTYEYLSHRGISKETFQYYGVATKVAHDGRPVAVAFPYSKDARKVRLLGEKKFFSQGDMNSQSLFGKDKFSAGSARAITITEGEFDALAAFEALGSKYPVVSVRSASSAKKDCGASRDYLNSFEKIYLCFDNDEPGTKAAQEVASLFPFEKIYHVKLSKHKDANAYLEAGEAQEFRSIWFNAKRFVPEGVISSFAEIDRIIDEAKVKPTATYPFKQLQDMTYGIRDGECVLFTALEGIGKTEIFRAIEYHLLKTTDFNVGIIHLEESKDRTVKGLAGYELRSPCHLEEAGVSNADIKSAFRSVVTRDERLHIYSHFGSSDPNIILDTIRFLVAVCGCRYIFLDHITMVVTGLEGEDERKALDYISTQLKMMAKELGFTLFFISHVNDEGQTRGSRNISKVADLRVHLHRDLTSGNARTRNTTELTVYKNRFGAHTGPAGKLHFDGSTFMISELTEAQEALPPEREDV